jgi:hypothetical protein
VCIQDSCVYPEEDKAARVKAEANEKGAEAEQEFRAEYAQIKCFCLPAPASDLDMSDEELETELEKCFHGIGEDEENDSVVFAAARIGARAQSHWPVPPLVTWPSLSLPVYPTAPRATHCAKIVTKQTALTDSVIFESFDLSRRLPTICVCFTDLRPRTSMRRLLGMKPYSLLILILWLVIALAVS